MNMVTGIYSVVVQQLQIINLVLFVSLYLKIVAHKKLILISMTNSSGLCKTVK